MATLTADRPFVQHSLLDPHEEARDSRITKPRTSPPAAQPAHDHPAPPAAAAPPTLDDLVTGTWDALVVSHTASCLVCGGTLAPRWSAGPRPVGGRCTDCGSSLS